MCSVPSAFPESSSHSDHTEGLVAPSFAQIDMSIAQENIWLETDTLGLGGVWFGIAPIEEHMEEVHRLLGLPENVKVFSMFALGYPADRLNCYRL